MTKFYVYTISGDDEHQISCLYIQEDSIALFVEFEFQPHITKFSGVLVEADSPSEAHLVYNMESDNGNIFWVNEPEEAVKARENYEKQKLDIIERTKDNTEKKKAAFEKLNKELDKTQLSAASLVVSALAKSISLQFIDINKKISKMAEIVCKTTEVDPNFTAEIIYDKIKSQYMNQLKEYGYRDGMGPDVDNPPKG